MKVVFMGTPEFAVPSLRALIEAGHEIAGVFTQPDKPRNRNKVTFSPVKEYALSQGLAVYQPTKLRDGTALELVRSLAPELIVVVAYGRILPKDILNVPPLGCVNVHASLLPKYRGSAPINWAMLNGDTETGVSIMQLDEGCDTGDILMVEKVPIGPEETSGEVFDKVSSIGARTLVRAVDLLQEGKLTPKKQDDSQATQAPPLTKEMARFHFDTPAQTLHDLVRGMNPWPVAFFEYGGKKVKVLQSRIAENPEGAKPGTVLTLKPLTIACAVDALQLLSVTPEGGRPMDGTAWAAGRRLKAGDSL